MSKVYIGATFMSNMTGEFKVVAKANEPRYWVVKFLQTGYETVAKETNIPYGKVKDYMYPTVYGKGYLGACIRKPKGTLERRVYDLWANMLKRVYCEHSGQYKNVEVDPAWYNYLVFKQDIQDLEGYSAWLEDTTMCLDKDLIDRSARLYSRSTCKFVSLSENCSEAANHRWHGG